MCAHRDEPEPYLQCVKGGLTPGREQIWNFLKFDSPTSYGYEIRCKDLYRLIFGDAGSRDPQGCSHIQFASRGKVMQCLQCQYEMDKFWLRVGSYIETKDIPTEN